LPSPLRFGYKKREQRGQEMARAYSEDLRGRALDLLESGQKQQAVSKLLNIGLSTVKYWLKTWRTEGRRVAKSGYQKGHSHKITDTQVLQDIITKNPDKTLTEIGKMLPTPCAAETVRRGLKRLGFSYKKKSFIINNVIVHDAPLF
ncbi:MAG: transposase, partial [Holosporales bacterium]